MAGHPIGARSAVVAPNHNHELVSSEARDQVGRADLGDQTASHRCQHLITHDVTVEIIDLLETVRSQNRTATGSPR